MMSAPNATVMLEPGVRPEPLSPPDIKQEMGYVDDDDDDVYEDAGDLDMSMGDRAVWLVKLPQFLGERWKDIDEDEEIALGVVKLDRNAPDQKNVREICSGSVGAGCRVADTG